MLLMRRLLLLSALLIAVPGCGGAPASSSASQPPAPAASAPTAPMPLAAMPKIEGGAIMEHVKVLASDEYEGRAPGGKGDELTVKYIESQFTQLGLKPGNPDGTFFQKVPLVGITAKESRPLTLTTGTGQQTFKWGDDVVAWSKHVAATASLQASDVVFAGYGVEAPEYKWNDFKDVDVKGKTIIVLVNDPAVPDPADPSKLDPKTFGGDAMTYYGRWTYKFEEGARRGAAGILVVHETGPAGYPFSVVQSSLREKFDLVTPDKNMGRAAIEGWLTLDAAKKILAMGGQDFDALKKQALTREFKPVQLGLKASLAISNSLRTIDSRNVVARLEGSDARLKDDYVVYTAHWDHLGIGAPVKGDRIYNGALDNASGVGTVLEIAKAFTKSQPQPRRSILFLMVTAEEQGLLGSQYYSVNPLYPMEKTVANINIDGVNQWGRTKDLTLVGMGASNLDEYLRAAAAEQGRTLRPDPEPEKGFYYRSDHFNFAKQGVPALSPDAGVEYVGRSEEYGRKKRAEYNEVDYHAPSDQIKADWDFSGALEDAQLFFAVGYRVGNADVMPEWAEGNEFKAKRDQTLKRR